MNCYSIPLRCFKKVILRLCENSDLIYEIFTLGKRGVTLNISQLKILIMLSNIPRIIGCKSGLDYIFRTRSTQVFCVVNIAPIVYVVHDTHKLL